MPLETYRRKRDFASTPEPSGDGVRPKGRRASRSKAGQAPSGTRRYVVQRHRATRLHYDFRLEMDDVLVSWAVPKGPSLDPAHKRMAVHVEDHPLDYFDFEGVIPKGQYGGGDVIVWDWGTWEPEETTDPGKAVRDGELKFRLDGEKLKGRFTLVRTGGRGAFSSSDDKEQWLLIHKRDEDAQPDFDVDSLPRSVKTGRTNDEVAAGADAIWDSNAPAASAAIDLTRAVDAPMPDFIPPMKATLADRPFSDPDWLFELKLDGYRVEAWVQDGRIKLWTRNQQDAGRYFPDLTERPTWLASKAAIVDGEVVALNDAGEPDFSLLQDRTGVRAGQRGRAEPGRAPKSESAGDIPIVYYVFDLLHHEGRSLLEVPLEDRKRLLRTLLRDHELVRYGSHIDGDGEAFYEAARERGLEGLVAKHRRSRYEPGRRSRSWLKLKIRREQEVVVAGYVPGKGSHKDLGSLILGVYEEGRFVYIGEVGSGIDTKTRRQLVESLESIRRDDPPFEKPVRIKDARWAEPRLVVRVEFAEWTSDGLLRQSAYKGLELDRDPRTVTREKPVATGAATKAAEKAAEKDDRETSARRPRAPKRAAAPATRPATTRRTATATKATAAKPTSTKSPATKRAKPTKPDKPSTRTTSARRGSTAPKEPQAATQEELEALEQLGKEGLWEVGGQKLKLTNLDKVLFPPRPDSKDPPITKRELIAYYARIAPVMLTHLAERALNLHRYPNGTFGSGFWQKNVEAVAPDWVRTWRETGVADREANVHVVADRVATLCWLANMAAFEIHPWTSRIDAPDRPTYALVDIDPGDRSTFEQVLVLARLYRTALGHLGVTGFPKLTGKRGLQIWIPVRPRYSFAETSAWVEGISRAVGAMVPELVSWEWSVSERAGRIRLDYTQNASIKTLVAPYAVRPAAGAPVSAPLLWEELDDDALRPDRWTIRDMPERVESVGDPFAGALELEQKLPPLG
jgi:bifunctional non-homologous end joining protein LigD